MKRIFLAFNTDALAPELRELQKWLKENLPDNELRYADTFHLTTLFIGEVEDEVVAKIKNVLETIHVVPSAITFDHFVFFSNTIGIGGKPSRELSNLVALLSTELKKLKITLEDRDYYPHITLGRAPKGKKVKWKGELRKPIVFETEAFTLFESKRNERGSVYLELGVFGRL